MKAKIMVGIPTLQSLSMATYASLPALRRKDVAIELHFNSSTPLDRARNTIIEKFLESDCTHLLFLDSDIILPQNILSLLDRDKDVVTALYGIWIDAMPLFCIYEKTIERGLYRVINRFKSGELLEIDGCGLGCMLIKREVLEKLSPPWCSFSSWDEEKQKMIYAEDFHFCEKAKRAGYKIYADTGVECGHYVKTDLLEVVQYIGAGIEKGLIIDELKRYTGLKIDDIRKHFRMAAEDIAMEWNRIKPNTEEERDNFYRETSLYIYDLAYYNTLPMSLKIRKDIVKKVKGKVLDYGAGIGTFLIDCWEKGLTDLTYLDLKGETWKFAEWRFKQRDMNVKMIAPNELQGKYESIIIMDVLEHLTDWRRILTNLVNEHMEEDGVLFLTETAHTKEKGKNLYPQHFEIKRGEIRSFLEKLLKDREITYYLWEMNG